MGIIYKIENMDTGKVYIGQTVTNLRNRMAGHLDKVAKGNFKPGTIHSDIAEFGIDNFMISIIEYCNNDELSDRERYWISEYDSYKNGYNETSGGGSYASLSYKADEIVELAKQGKSMTQIASIIGCTLTAVRTTLEANGVEYTKDVGRGPLKVVMYDKSWKPLRLWNSISESYREVNKGQSSESSHQHNVRIACGTGKEVYGYKWALLEDLIIYKNGRMLICRSPLDRENIENDMPFEIKDNIAITEIAPKQLQTKLYCRFCGVELFNGETICKDCRKKHPRCFENKQAKVKLPKERVQIVLQARNRVNEYKQRPTPKADLLPSKEVLEELIKTNTYKSIADKYGVSESTLRDKLKEYGLYEVRANFNYNKKQIVKDLILGNSIKHTAKLHNVSEWVVHNCVKEYNIPSWLYSNETPVACKNEPNGQRLMIFESLVKAMEFFYADGGTKSSRNSLRWKIGNAAKNGTKVKGYYWELVDIEPIRRKLIEELDKMED